VIKGILKSIVKHISDDEINALAKNSVENHHVNGIQYLCLHRSNDLTVKVYFIPGYANINDGYLVNPHNHRYDFDSEVISGEIEHHRFKVTKGKGEWEQLGYCHKKKDIEHLETEVRLKTYKIESHKEGSGYHTDANEIHTLKVIVPTILGLIQYKDVNFESHLYARDGIKISNSCEMSAQLYRQLLNNLKTSSL